MICDRCGATARADQRFCTACGNALDVDGERTQPIDPVGGDAAGWDPPEPRQPLEPTQPIEVTAAEPERTQPVEVVTAEPERTQPVEVTAAESGPTPAAEPTGHDAEPGDQSAEPGDDDADPGDRSAEPGDEPPAVRLASPRLYDLALDEPDLLHDPAPPWPAPGPATSTDRVPTTPTARPAALPRTDQIPTGTGSPNALLDDDDSLAGRFRIGAVSGVGLVAGMTALFGMFLRVTEIRTDASDPSFPTGEWLVSDLAGNLPGAMVAALLTLLVGIVGAGFGQRWGAGLAGGAGLGIAGWAAITIGLAERPIEAAIDAVGRPTDEAFTVTITRDVGYWVLLAAGALGVLTFVVSLLRAGRDGRGLNPWIASLGAVAAVIAAAGPMLPEGTATIADNWSPGSGGLGQPTWYVIGRLVQLGLLAYTGVVGFLLVRSYGLGLVIGGMTVSVWLALSTLLDLGTGPVGPGVTNPGERGPIDLHSVTIVGMTALVGLVVVAVIAAVEQSVRESR